MTRDEFERNVLLVGAIALIITAVEYDVRMIYEFIVWLKSF